MMATEATPVRHAATTCGDDCVPEESGALVANGGGAHAAMHEEPGRTSAGKPSDRHPACGPAPQQLMRSMHSAHAELLTVQAAPHRSS